MKAEMARGPFGEKTELSRHTVIISADSAIVHCPRSGFSFSFDSYRTTAVIVHHSHLCASGKDHIGIW